MTEEELAKDTKEYAIGYKQGRADERERIKEAIYDFIADEYGKYTGDDRFIVDEWRKELMKINKRLGEIVRGEK